MCTLHHLLPWGCELMSCADTLAFAKLMLHRLVSRDSLVFIHNANKKLQKAIDPNHWPAASDSEAAVNKDPQNNRS